MYISFFGHRDCVADISERMERVILSLLEELGGMTVYVGNNGAFDSLALDLLRKIAKKHPELEYCTVLAYYNEKELIQPSVYPEEAAKALPRFAIVARNKWMVDRSDIVVTYVKRGFGGAYQMKEYAIKKGKRVIELSESMAL